MYLSICFEFDKVFFFSLVYFFFFFFFFFFLVWQVLLMWRRKKGRKKKKWWAVLVMFTWIDWNLTWKFNQSSVLMQNNDNFKQLLFSKQKTKKRLHLTPVCSGLVLQADQQAPKGCHQSQGTRSCSDFHAETLSALLQMKPCSLEVEPRFNRAIKWNHSTSCSPQHITFKDSNQSWRKWKNKM